MTDAIKTISRPGMAELEFRQCPMWMVSPGDIIIVPSRRMSSGAEVFGRVGDVQTEGNAIFSYTRVAARIMTEAGFEIVAIEDDSSRTRVWVLVP